MFQDYNHKMIILIKKNEARVVYEFVSLDIEFFFKRQNVRPKSISFKGTVKKK